MARYIQTAVVGARYEGEQENTISWNYMGSAEFEFGSVSSSLKVLRNLPCLVKDVPDHFLVTKGKKNLVNKGLIMIAPISHLDTNEKKYIDFCMEDFLSSLKKSRFEFKERPDFNFIFSYTDSNVVIATEEQVKRVPTNLWLAVDPFVRVSQAIKGFDVKEIQEDWERHIGYEELNSHKTFLYLVTTKDNLHNVITGAALKKVRLPGGVSEEDIRMFDSLIVRFPEGNKKVKVVALLEDKMTVELENGKREKVPYHFAIQRA